MLSCQASVKMLKCRARNVGILKKVAKMICSLLFEFISQNCRWCNTYLDDYSVLNDISNDILYKNIFRFKNFVQSISKQQEKNDSNTHFICKIKSFISSFQIVTIQLSQIRLYFYIKIYNKYFRRETNSFQKNIRISTIAFVVN